MTDGAVFPLSIHAPYSAADRWLTHLFSCEVCEESPFEPEFRLCAIGAELRAASITAMRETSESRGVTPPSSGGRATPASSGPIQGAA